MQQFLLIFLAELGTWLKTVTLMFIFNVNAVVTKETSAYFGLASHRRVAGNV